MVLAWFLGAVNTSLLPTVTLAMNLWESEATEPDLSPALSLVVGAVGAVVAGFSRAEFSPVTALALLPMDMSSSISSRRLSSISSSAPLVLVLVISLSGSSEKLTIVSVLFQNM